jgi:hypothetical protein
MSNLSLVSPIKPKPRHLSQLRDLLEEARATKNPAWWYLQIIELLEQAQERIEAGLWAQAQERLRVAAKKERVGKDVDIVERYQARFDLIKKVCEVREAMEREVAKPASEVPVFLVSPEQEHQAAQEIIREHRDNNELFKASLKRELKAKKERAPLALPPELSTVLPRLHTPEHPLVTAQQRRELSKALINAFWDAIIGRDREAIEAATLACKAAGLEEVYREVAYQLGRAETPWLSLPRQIAKAAWEGVR